MKKNNFYKKGHLVVAAIRIHEHIHAGPPTIEDICRTLSISLEEGNRLCLKLSDMNIIEVLEKAGESRIFVRDHLKIEEIPLQEEQPSIQAELEKFKKSKEAHNEKIKNKTKNLINTNDIILITVENSILVNALQRISSVIIQKSLREGFGLTVTEALWKEKPVVASNVGGIPLQITDGKDGFLVDPFDVDVFAERTVELLKNPSLAKEIGKKGKETVRKKFLMTRSLSDYLDLLNDISC